MWQSNATRCTVSEYHVLSSRHILGVLSGYQETASSALPSMHAPPESKTSLDSATTEFQKTKITDATHTHPQRYLFYLTMLFDLFAWYFWDICKAGLRPYCLHSPPPEEGTRYYSWPLHNTVLEHILLAHVTLMLELNISIFYLNY